MTQLDSTVVNVSLATISHALDSSIATAQWIVSGYLLALALMLPSTVGSWTASVQSGSTLLGSLSLLLHIDPDRPYTRSDSGRSDKRAHCGSRT